MSCQLVPCQILNSYLSKDIDDIVMYNDNTKVLHINLQVETFQIMHSNAIRQVFSSMKNLKKITVVMEYKSIDQQVIDQGPCQYCWPNTLSEVDIKIIGQECLALVLPSQEERPEGSNQKQNGVCPLSLILPDGTSNLSVETFKLEFLNNSRKVFPLKFVRAKKMFLTRTIDANILTKEFRNFKSTTLLPKGWKTLHIRYLSLSWQHFNQNLLKDIPNKFNNFALKGLELHHNPRIGHEQECNFTDEELITMVKKFRYLNILIFHNYEICQTRPFPSETFRYFGEKAQENPEINYVFRYGLNQFRSAYNQQMKDLEDEFLSRNFLYE